MNYLILDLWFIYTSHLILPTTSMLSNGEINIKRKIMVKKFAIHWIAVLQCSENPIYLPLYVYSPSSIKLFVKSYQLLFVFLVLKITTGVGILLKEPW